MDRRIRTCLVSFQSGFYPPCLNVLFNPMPHATLNLPSLFRRATVAQWIHKPERKAWHPIVWQEQTDSHQDSKHHHVQVMIN